MIGGVTRRILPHLTGVHHFHVNRLALSSLSLHRPPYARMEPLPTYISHHVSLWRRYKYKKQGHLIWTVITAHYILPPKKLIKNSQDFNRTQKSKKHSIPYT